MNEQFDHVCKKEEIIQDIKKDIELLKKDNREIIRLSTLMEMQIEQSKQQGKVIMQQSETLIKVAEYISEQKETLKIMNEKMESQENKIDELDRKFMQQNFDSVSRNSFNIIDLIKKAIPYIIVFGIAYLLSKADVILSFFK